MAQIEQQRESEQKRENGVTDPPHNGSSLRCDKCFRFEAEINSLRVEVEKDDDTLNCSPYKL